MNNSQIETNLQFAYKLRRNNPYSVSHSIAAGTIEDLCEVIKELQFRIEEMEQAVIDHTNNLKQKFGLLD